MNSLSILLAQAASQTAPPAATAPPAGGNTFLGQILPLILMMVVFYWLLFRGQRKERNRQVEMLRNLKRNDRVQTIGGIFGTIVDVRDHEVVLKVDESSNVKIRFNRSAIKEVLAADAAAATAPVEPAKK